MSSVGIVPFILFRGEDGAVILQKAEDISTVIAVRKPARAGKPAYDACYLFLKNNNRVEVLGETVVTVFDKLELANDFRPRAIGQFGDVADDQLHPEPEPEKEPSHG